MTDKQKLTSHLHSMVKLKGSSNYETWAIKTQMVLIRKRLWDAIKPNNNFTSLGTTASTTKSTNSPTFAIIDKTLNQQAMATIILLLDNSLIDHAISISLAKTLWKTLKDLFTLQGFTACHLLHKELATTTLANSKSVGDFINSLKQCKQCLQEMGSPVPNWILSSTLPHNLGDAYKSFVSSTLQKIQGTEPNLNIIISQLLDKE